MIELMKMFANIIRWLSSQTHLYFLFGILFMIPNIVLFVTDPQPVTAAIASLLLPLAFWDVLLLITRKPGIVVLCLLPKVILDGGQLVLLKLFGQSVIAVDMYLNLTSSDASEASELLENIGLIIGCVFLFYTLPTLWLAIRSVRLKDKLPDVFRKKMAFSSLSLFLIGIVLCFMSPLQDYRFSLKNDVYPVNAFYNLYFAIHKAKKNNQYPVTSAQFKFNSMRTDHVSGKREIYVLVVGETSRAMEWSLYGYGRPTTPRLQKLDGLVYFRDVITQSNNTHKSVPIILSAASAENYGVIYNEKSIVTAFKEAGFRTLVIANQKLTSLMIQSYYHVEVVCCKDSNLVLDYLQKTVFDAIITDIQMPGMDGYQLLKVVRVSGIEGSDNIPVIALSASVEKEHTHYTEAGFTGFLNKPFTAKQLITLLNQLLITNISPEAAVEFNFNSLTAFAGEDKAASASIVRTFTEETNKSIALLQEALNKNDKLLASKVAHKLLPLFSMIGAKSVIAQLRVLEVNDDALTNSGWERLMNEVIRQAVGIVEQAKLKL